ncbi:non-LTR retrolelement reverse transcriptase [Canna indica]|uniref:Non-LTR retrolelement reverse transcriptase n=1 Tax=Canna indica TaxID=4628 RepID=A0AAQ3JZL7_9LILI|nr:non-LTR retrolelement reverse transcriptase [Canna indica]
MNLNKLASSNEKKLSTPPSTKVTENKSTGMVIDNSLASEDTYTCTPNSVHGKGIAFQAEKLEPVPIQFNTEKNLELLHNKLFDSFAITVNRIRDSDDPSVVIMDNDSISSSMPVLGKPEKRKLAKRKRRFVFELYWLEKESITQLVKDNWERSPFMETSLSTTLSVWSREIFSSLEKELKSTLEELGTLEAVDEAGVATDYEVNRIKSLTNKAMAPRQIHIKWWTKARTNWVDMNDKNTKYFHNLVKYKRRQNTILQISMDGKVCTETKMILTEYVKWYSCLWEKECMDSNVAIWE